MLLLPFLLAGCDDAGVGSASLSGALLPMVDLEALDGSVFRFAADVGPCLINFWATWCSPCRAEMASLNRLFGQFAAQNLRVFGVSVDEDRYLLREFLMKELLDFPILLDPKAMAARQVFKVTGFPTTFLVDRKGRIRDVWVGERDWDAPPIRAAVGDLLSG